MSFVWSGSWFGVVFGENVRIDVFIVEDMFYLFFYSRGGDWFVWLGIVDKEFGVVCGV